MLEAECELDKLLQMQLEVNKDLMCHKTQKDDRQYHLRMAKDSLSKLLLRIQDLKTNIQKQKPEWDYTLDGCFNDVVLAPLEVTLIEDAHFTSFEIKTFEVFTTLKKLESKEF